MLDPGKGSCACAVAAQAHAETIKKLNEIVENFMRALPNFRPVPVSSRA